MLTAPWEFPVCLLPQSAAGPGFVVEKPGQGNLAGLFEDDGNTGWLYLMDSDRSATGDLAVLSAVLAYDHACGTPPPREEVSVAWSEDFTTLAALVRNQVQAVIDVKTRRAVRTNTLQPGLGRFRRSGASSYQSF